MNLSTAQLGLACRIFLKLAYPAGFDAIPAKKRLYYDIPADRPLADFLPPTPGTPEICQATTENGELRGVALRLGCVHFPHLKLKVHPIERNGSHTPVFAVDTHDAFSSNSRVPPEDHPDYEAWLTLQRNNRELKEKIESAWQSVGLTTFNSLLRSDLQNAST